MTRNRLFDRVAQCREWLGALVQCAESCLRFSVLWARAIAHKRRGTDPTFRVDGRSLIVSMTSIPSRLLGIPITLDSIFRQSVKPTRLLLWLPRRRFPTRATVPWWVRALARRGLEIHFSESDRPHDKLLPTIQADPNAIVVTIDDDIIYSTRMIARLLDGHRHFPEAVICHSARSITFTSNGNPAPYETWTLDDPALRTPSHKALPLGVMGVLYPPASLHPDVLNAQVAAELAPTADDLWFKVMALRRGTKAVLLSSASPAARAVPFSQKVSLWDINRLAAGNVQQWCALLSRFHVSADAFRD
jgi:hypothetical protein